MNEPTAPVASGLLPAEASLVIVGAGIVGSSIAYHLAERGWRDVVVVDQGDIPATGGSTSHAPGGVFVTNFSRTMTRFALDTVELLSRLELDGAPCFLPVGTLEVARTTERWQDHRRKLGVAASWGVPAELLGPDETRQLVPLVDPSSILGSYHVAIDGIAKPLRSTAALLRRAAAAGFALHERTTVTGFDLRVGQVHGVETDRGRIVTSRVVVCGGIWGPLLGELLGTTIPLIPCEHQYVITTALASLAGTTAEASQPMMRDQDRALYYRQHGDRYGVGSYQHVPLLVDVHRIRRHGEPAATSLVNPHGEHLDLPSLMPFTPDHFEPAWRDACQLLPELRTVTPDYRINGMFSFTPDGFPVMGESPNARGAWIAEAVWITHAGGVGRVMADWITDGEPGLDIHEMDIDRFEADQRTRAYVRARGARNYDEVYDLIHPGQPLGVARPLRVSPFHERLEALGAVFFEGRGWERAQWFDANAPAPGTERTGWAAQFWSPSAATEHLATRERVGLFDLTSLTRVEVRGPDAETFLQRIVTNDVAVPVGSVVYSAMCAPSGGIRSDVTISRLALDHYQLGLNGPQDVGHLHRSRRDDERVEISETTTGTTAIGLWGPRSRDLLATVTHDDITNEGFPYLTVRPIEVADLPVLAQRISYVGELGWELYAEAAVGRQLWDVLWEAGRSFGAVAAGRAAFDTLRLEKGYRLWGQDMTIDDDPYEAGIGFTVRLAKPSPGGEFIGCDALAGRRDAGRKRALAWLRLDDPTAVVLGKEPVRSGGEVVAYVRSAGFGYSVGACLATAMLPVELAKPGTPLTIEWFGTRLGATVVKDPVFDPAGERIRA